MSGDDETTLSGTMRGSVRLDKSSVNTTPRVPQSAMKGGRRGSSPLPPLGPEIEKITNRSPLGGESGVDDTVHGGAHLSHTANVLDPRVGAVRPVDESYQAGPDAEAGQHESRA